MTDRNAPEQWRAVVGFEGLYEVSDLGRVRSPRRVLAQHPNTTDRLLVRLVPPTGGKRVFRTVHGLVAAAFHGPRPAGMEACHNNGDHRDNRSGNLRWDTHSRNMIDAVGHRTHANVRKTTCPRGHALVAENLCADMFRRNGSRSCLACSRARAFARVRLQRYGEVIDVDQEADRRYDQIIGKP